MNRSLIRELKKIKIFSQNKVIDSKKQNVFASKHILLQQLIKQELSFWEENNFQNQKICSFISSQLGLHLATSHISDFNFDTRPLF